MLLNDETEERTFIQERFYSDRFHKRYKKGLFKFKDAFSKQYISEDDTIQSINFYRLFKKEQQNTTEETYERVSMDYILNAIAQKYE